MTKKKDSFKRHKVVGVAFGALALTLVAGSQLGENLQIDVTGDNAGGEETNWQCYQQQEGDQVCQYCGSTDEPKEKWEKDGCYGVIMDSGGENWNMEGEHMEDRDMEGEHMEDWKMEDRDMEEHKEPPVGKSEIQDLQKQLNGPGALSDKKWEFDQKKISKLKERLEKQFERMEKVLERAKSKGYALDGADQVSADFNSAIAVLDNISRALANLKSEYESSVADAKSCVSSISADSSREEAEKCRKLVRYNETFREIGEFLTQKTTCLDWLKTSFELKEQYFQTQFDFKGKAGESLSKVSDLIKQRDKMIGQCQATTEENYESAVADQEAVSGAIGSDDFQDLDFAMEDFWMNNEDRRDSMNDLFDRDRDFWESDPFRLFGDFHKDFKGEEMKPEFEFENVGEAIDSMFGKIDEAQKMIGELKKLKSYTAAGKYSQCVNDLESIVRKVKTAFEGLRKKVDADPASYDDKSEVEELLASVMAGFEGRLNDNMQCIADEAGDKLPDSFWRMMDDGHDEGEGNEGEYNEGEYNEGESEELKRLKLKITKLEAENSALSGKLQELADNKLIMEMVGYQKLIPNEWMEATADIQQKMVDLDLLNLVKNTKLGQKYANRLEPLMHIPIAPDADRTKIKTALEDLANALEAEDQEAADEAVKTIVATADESKKKQIGKFKLKDVDLFPEGGEDPAWFAEHVIGGLGKYWNGYGDGNFGPQDPLYYDAAAKIILTSTGLAQPGDDLSVFTKQFESMGIKLDWGTKAKRGEVFRMMFTALNRSIGLDVAGCANLVDVGCDHPFAGMFQALKSGGFVTGKGNNGALDVDGEINRAEMSALTMRAVGQIEVRMEANQFDAALDDLDFASIGTPPGNHDNPMGMGTPDGNFDPFAIGTPPGN